ncbi:spirocyclase AveC family protein [Streptomyces sp. NPDC021093]|uniref:spirocyclase AveC family protein n=1 Tax=Streptomyces sp. NPDC021093 TaxID=3365112 RepID=UPI0037A8E8F3
MANRSPVPGPAERTPSSRWWCPSVYWAAAGLSLMVFLVPVFVRWALDGNAHAHPATGYTIPDHLKILTHICQAILFLIVVGAGIMCWRTSRRLGAVSISAALLIGFCLSGWASPYINTFHYVSASNRYDFNVISWGPYLPGLQGQPPGVESFNLAVFGFAAASLWYFVAIAIMRFLHRRRPRWSTLRIIAVTQIPMLLVDVVGVQLLIRFGGFCFANTFPGITMFADEWYQRPMVSFVTFAFGCVLPLTAMVFSAEVRNRTVLVLRGCDQLPGPIQPWVRIFAGIGVVNLFIFVFAMTEALASLLGHPSATVPQWCQLPQPHAPQHSLAA